MSPVLSGRIKVSTLMEALQPGKTALCMSCGFYMSHTIIESIDSIYRDGTETQYMIIKKNLSKSQSNELTRFITTYHSSSSIFMANKIHSGTKNIAKEPNQKVTK